MKTLMWCAIALMFVCLPAAARAQEPGVDDETCKDRESRLLPRMPGCGLYECSSKEFDAAEVVVTMSGETKSLEGALESFHFICPARLSPLQISRNAEAALKKAGYSIVVAGRAEDREYPMVTARKGAQWVALEMSMFNEFPSYRQTEVLVQDMEQQMTASAEAMAQAIEASGRIDVYGITFATGQATITPESDQVLTRVLEMLQANPDWKLRVEGHTDNAGTPASNLKLSQARAVAVVAWLTGRGIAADRLTAAGVGDSQPVDSNETDEGRARNRRVVLIKQ